MSQNKTNDEIWDETKREIDILQLNKGIATEQLLERQSSQASVFHFPSSRLWLEVLSFHLDLNEPQKENILFSFFFSTPHSSLPSLLPFLEICSNIRNQNGGASLMRAETESRWGSLGGWGATYTALG